MVRPNKYQGESGTPSHGNFYIPNHFRETWKRFQRLAVIEFESSKEFRYYIENIEGEDIKKVRKQGQNGLYLRFLISQAVLKNMNKLQEA